jgi:transformation/transcription domain-associated protein
MDSLGENLERSNLYLKLFKLVFGSVTLFAQENELMLKVGAKSVCVCVCV